MTTPAGGQDQLVHALLYGNGGIGKCTCETCNARRKAADEILRLRALVASSESTTSADHYRNGWNEAIDRAALTSECADPNDGRNHDECPFCTSARVIRQLKVPL